MNPTPEQTLERLKEEANKKWGANRPALLEIDGTEESVIVLREDELDTVVEEIWQTAYEAGKEAGSELDEFIINNALWERDREWLARINNPNNSKYD